MPVRATIISLTTAAAAALAWWIATPQATSPAASAGPAQPATVAADAKQPTGSSPDFTATIAKLDVPTARRLVAQSCKSGREYEARQSFVLARATYETVLQMSLPKGVDIGCAWEGRSRAVSVQERALVAVRAGRQYAQSGHIATAERQYRWALQADPSSVEARAELATLAGGLASARRDVAFGRYRKARESLAASTGAPPVELPPDLAFLASLDGLLWRYVQDVLSSWVALIGIGLGALGAFAWVTARRTLNIEAFTGDAAAAADAPAFVALVGQELQALSESRPGTLHLVRAPLAEIAIPAEVSKLAPSWGSLAEGTLAALKWLVPRPTATVSGVMRQHEDSGTVVTLTLTHGSRIVASGTVRERDFVDVRSARRADAARQVLAQAIATWILFALDRKRRLLGTTNWKSYALFRAAGQAGDPETRRRFLTEALALDVNNLGARLNLSAWLLARRENEAAERELRAVILRTMRDRPDGFLTRDTIWYSAMYRWAEALFACGRLRQAKRVAHVLVAAMEAMRVDGALRRRRGALAARFRQVDQGGHLWLHLTAAAWRPDASGLLVARCEAVRCRRRRATSHVWRHAWSFWRECRHDERLQAFLDVMLPVARAMFAGLAIAARDIKTARRERAMLDDADSSRSLTYNLACCDALDAARKGNAGSARCVDSGMVRLRAAVVLGADEAWVARDPALAELAVQRPAAFAALAGAGDLRPIAGMGRSEIHALLEAGITTAAELVAVCGTTSENVLTLARRVGRSAEELRSWARIAELRCSWTHDPEALPLVLECGVASVLDLRRADGAKLEAAVAAVYARRLPLRNPPDAQTVAAWIAAAPQSSVR